MEILRRCLIPLFSRMDNRPDYSPVRSGRPSWQYIPRGLRPCLLA